MKQRFSSLDVKVIAYELSSALVSLRISNIYDLSSRIFLIKFARPGKREQLIVDSGFRCHLTSFSRTAASTPSAFVSRLRKYLKSKRVTGVGQVGTDRVIEITFSDGQYRLFLEFFAAGNIILTDADLNVLALLRQVSEGDEAVDVRLGSKYVIDAKQNFHGVPPISLERVKDALDKAVQRATAAKEIGGKKAKRAKGGDDLRKALSAEFQEYPPHLLDHVFTQVGIDATWKVEDVLGGNQKVETVMSAIQKAEEVFRSLDNGAAKGYIIAKERPAAEEIKEITNGGVPARDTLLYDDFHPFRPSQFDTRPGVHILEFDGFNKTVDEFYSSIESQKLESRLTEKEEAAKKKLENAKNEHEKRLGALQHVQELHIRKAQTIEANSHRVEEACAAVNGLIGQGMDWVDIGKLIEREQERDNVVAQMIKLPLKLHENTVTLLLDEPGAGEDEDSNNGDVTDEDLDSDEEATKSKPETRSAEKRLSIDIDLALSPWANARQYYDQKKTAAVKEQKTIQASTRALKSTEKKIEADLKKGLKQEKSALRPARKQFWFEKFLYFISSDGYLVIGGKDAQQNELIYRRYLKKGDIYVHADLQGASSVVVKNNPQTPDAPIPPSTLSQAGALTVCTSNAWDSKAVMAAWWVNSDQVSKTAPTGEYLTTGGFMIRGKKNFLPPSQLLLGFGVMWLISEDSRTNHGKHRVTRTESMVDGEAEALANDLQGTTIEDDNAEDQIEDVVPDIEDAGPEAQNEVEDDNEGVEHDDSDDEKASTVVSEIGVERANPLQNNGVKSPDPDSDDSPEVEIEAEAEPSRAHSPDESVSEAEEEEQDESQDPAIPETTEPPTNTTTTTSKSQPQPKQTPLSRGKRNKAKRAAKKYADQDEEDRQLAMELLGSAKGQEKKTVAEEEKAAREAKALADKERRRAQHTKNAERERAKHERLAKAGEAGGADAADGGSGVTAGDTGGDEEIDVEQLELERKEHQNISLLVHTPEPGDELVAAIPVVAPWGALGRCKYKVKLQPGNMKKGKALREIVAVWTSLGSKGPKVVDESNQDKERVWAREVELLKTWRVEEIVGVLPVKGVRIVQGGGVNFYGGAGGAGGAGGGSKGKGNPARGSKGGKKGR